MRRRYARPQPPPCGRPPIGHVRHLGLVRSWPPAPTVTSTWAAGDQRVAIVKPRSGGQVSPADLPYQESKKRGPRPTRWRSPPTGSKLYVGVGPSEPLSCWPTTSPRHRVGPLSFLAPRATSWREPGREPSGAVWCTAPGHRAERSGTFFSPPDREPVPRGGQGGPGAGPAGASRRSPELQRRRLFWVGGHRHPWWCAAKAPATGQGPLSLGPTVPAEPRGVVEYFGSPVVSPADHAYSSYNRQPVPDVPGLARMDPPRRLLIPASARECPAVTLGPLRRLLLPVPPPGAAPAASLRRTAAPPSLLAGGARGSSPYRFRPGRETIPDGVQAVCHL